MFRFELLDVVGFRLVHIIFNIKLPNCKNSQCRTRVTKVRDCGKVSKSVFLLTVSSEGGKGLYGRFIAAHGYSESLEDVQAGQLGEVPVADSSKLFGDTRCSQPTQQARGRSDV